MIDPEGVIDLTSELVSIPSVTGEEAAVAQRIAEACDALGMTTSLQQVEPGRENVIATLAGGDGPRILLTGHVDVVPPGEGWSRDPFVPVVEGGRIFGRGTTDMKGGLAAMLSAISSLVADGVQPPGDVVFAAVVGEEEDQAGTAHMVAQGIDVDLAVVGEPTETDVVRGHKGCVAYRVQLGGRAAHASMPMLGVNAIECATDVVLSLRRVAASLEVAPDPEFGAATITVGTITGGTRPYVVPDQCTIEVDRRLVPGETIETALDEIRHALAEAATRRMPVSSEVELVAGALPFEVPATHPLVQAAVEAAKAGGGRGNVILWPAVSDASILANDGGIATILLGPGSIAESAHRPDEYVSIDDLVACARAYELLIRRSVPRPTG